MDEVLTLARLYRAALEHLGVKALPKVTGKRGIQIWVPVKPSYTYEETRRLGRGALARRRRGRAQLVQLGVGQASRSGKARLDFTQNAVNKTLVAPYAVRPGRERGGLGADRLGRARRPGAAPDRWDIKTVLDRATRRATCSRPC